MIDQWEMDKGEFDRILALIVKSGKPEPSDYAQVNEILSKSGALQRVLCQILTESDEKLTSVGRGDLSTDQSVKALARLQGEAIGLSNAVDTIIELATLRERRMPPKE